MDVVVADAFDLTQLQRLREQGCAVTYVPGASGEALVKVLANARGRALVVRSTRVTREVIEESELELIVRAGSGVDTIDLAAAAELGVAVANCPGQNAAAVAELSWGLIIALDRRIPDNVEWLRKGLWNKREFARARGLKGRTLGLLGLGAIGREVAVRGAAFGMRVVGWSRSVPAGTRTGQGVLALDSAVAVASEADVLSVHLALSGPTRGIVNDHVLGALRPGALFVNTARAELVDAQALERAVARGVRVALDVFSNEPATAEGSFSDPAAAWRDVYGTHHIGASTEQAQEAVCAEAVRIVDAFARTGEVLNAVAPVALKLD